MKRQAVSLQSSLPLFSSHSFFSPPSSIEFLNLHSIDLIRTKLFIKFRCSLYGITLRELQRSSQNSVSFASPMQVIGFCLICAFDSNAPISAKFAQIDEAEASSCSFALKLIFLSSINWKMSFESRKASSYTLRFLKFCIFITPGIIYAIFFPFSPTFSVFRFSFKFPNSFLFQFHPITFPSSGLLLRKFLASFTTKPNFDF